MLQIAKLFLFVYIFTYPVGIGLYLHHTIPQPDWLKKTAQINKSQVAKSQVDIAIKGGKFLATVKKKITIMLFRVFLFSLPSTLSTAISPTQMVQLVKCVVLASQLNKKHESLSLFVQGMLSILSFVSCIYIYIILRIITLKKLFLEF